MAADLHGIFVGTEMFEEMNRAITVNHIKPVIDRVLRSTRRGRRSRITLPGRRRQGCYRKCRPVL
jgi:hypothetical protein